jgi:hypothetical protein
MKKSLLLAVSFLSVLSAVADDAKTVCPGTIMAYSAKDRRNYTYVSRIVLSSSSDAPSRGPEGLKIDLEIDRDGKTYFSAATLGGSNPEWRPMGFALPHGISDDAKDLWIGGRLYSGGALPTDAKDVHRFSFTGVAGSRFYRERPAIAQWICPAP